MTHIKCSYHYNEYTNSHGALQEHVVSEVTSTESCIVSFSRLTRRVLTPFPENGIQKRSMFQRNASGMQAGRKPVENDRTLAIVVEESGTEE